MNNFIFAVIGVAIAMLVSFVSCWIMFGIWAKQGKLDPKELGEIKEIDNNIYAPVEGETVELSKVEDEVFSSLAMGNGIAINPSKGEVKAPLDGEVTVLFPTGHAIGIKGDNGAEVLIHVGMDTVTLNGEGFDVEVKQGDRVKKGQVLVNFDIDFIKSKNLSTITPVVVTNTSSLKEVVPHDAGKVTNEDVIINIK